MKSDLISRQAVIEALLEKGQASKRYRIGDFWELNFEEIREAISTVPSAQPERKRGKWIPTQNPQWKAYYHDKCSVCGWWNTKNAVCRDSKKKARSLNYCPNCGAMMVKEGDDLD